MVPACGILCTESQAHQVDTTSTVRISRMFEVAGFSELSFNHQSSYKRFGKATPTVLNDYAIFSIVLIDFEWHLLYTVYEFSASRLDMDRTTTGGVYDEKGSQALGTNKRPREQNTEIPVWNSEKKLPNFAWLFTMCGK